MRSATSPALAVRSTRTWLAPGFLGLTSPGSPASHVPVNLHAHSPSLSLPTLAEVESRRQARVEVSCLPPDHLQGSRPARGGARRPRLHTGRGGARPATVGL